MTDFPSGTAYPTVAAYVRGNFPFWAKRWALAMLGAAILTAGVGLKGRHDVIPAIAAAGMLMALTLCVVALSLALAGLMHVRGFRPKPWMTKERGLLASIVAQVVVFMLICGLGWLYGM